MCSVHNQTSLKISKVNFMHVSVWRRLENSYSVEWNVPSEHKNGNEHIPAGWKTWFLMCVTVIHE